MSLKIKPHCTKKENEHVDYLIIQQISLSFLILWTKHRITGKSVNQTHDQNQIFCNDCNNLYHTTTYKAPRLKCPFV